MEKMFKKSLFKLNEYENNLQTKLTFISGSNKATIS